MRLIHTADWHLGRLFHNVHLTADQEVVLAQLVELVDQVKPHAVLVAGDLGHPLIQGVLAVAWIGFCIYTWVGPALFQKQIKRELEPATLHSKY